MENSGDFLSQIRNSVQSLFNNVSRGYQNLPEPVKRMGSSFVNTGNDLVNATVETGRGWTQLPVEMLNKIQGKSPLPVAPFSNSAQRGLDIIGAGMVTPPTGATDIGYLINKLRGKTKAFVNLEPGMFTKEAIEKSLDETGNSLLDDMYFHVRQTKYTGDIPNTTEGIYFNKGQPFKHGEIYAIDTSKLDPTKIFTDPKVGYTRYNGNIPKNAYIYLGKWKPFEPLNLIDKIKNVLSSR